MKLSPTAIEEQAKLLATDASNRAFHAGAVHLVLNMRFSIALCGVPYPAPVMVLFPLYKNGRSLSWQVQPPAVISDISCPDCHAVLQRAMEIIQEREKA